MVERGGFGEVLAVSFVMFLIFFPSMATPVSGGSGGGGYLWVEKWVPHFRARIFTWL